MRAKDITEQTEQTTKQFHLGDVLSITTGQLVAKSHMDAMYQICGFMEGQDLFTHQIVMVADECKEALLAQFPQLAEVKVDGLTELLKTEKPEDACVKWLDELIAQGYPEWYEVKPLDHASDCRNPVGDLVGMLGGSGKTIKA